LFRYFPTNYVWNLSVDLAIEMGARIGEIEAMCAPLQEAARAPDAAGTKAFRETWVRMADQLCGLAEEDEAQARLLSAGEKYRRAAGYLITHLAGWRSTSARCSCSRRARSWLATRYGASRFPMRARICRHCMCLPKD
jgi:hypothetical protein